MRMLTQEEATANLPTCFALSYTQSGGATSMSVEILQRFADAGALIIPTIAEDVPPDAELPEWVPLPNNGNPFIPRSYLVCFILNQASYEAACNSAPLSDLLPWREGDGDAYALIVTVISFARNGVARLVVAFSERMEAHPAFSSLKEVMWYTRTAKGQAMTHFFEGQETGMNVTRTFVNGKTQSMPVYRLAVSNWHKHVDAVVEKLVGIEDNFTETLAEIHQKMKEGKV